MPLTLKFSVHVVSSILCIQTARASAIIFHCNVNITIFLTHSLNFQKQDLNQYLSRIVQQQHYHLLHVLFQQVHPRVIRTVPIIQTNTRSTAATLLPLALSCHKTTFVKISRFRYFQSTHKNLKNKLMKEKLKIILQVAEHCDFP